MKWDNGTHNAYRYGEEGKSDIVETQRHPRQIPPDSTMLDFGVRVVRGKCALIGGRMLKAFNDNNCLREIMLTKQLHVWDYD